MNKKLKDKRFVVPNYIKDNLKEFLNEYDGDKTIEGYGRANHILSVDSISYYDMKRIKNFFDTFVGKKEQPQYQLNGGDRMRHWINKQLSTNRDSIKKGGRIKMDIGIENVFKKTHTKNKSANPTQIKLPRLQTKNRQIFTNKGIYECKMKNLIRKHLNEQIENDQNDVIFTTFKDKVINELIFNLHYRKNEAIELADNYDEMIRKNHKNRGPKQMAQEINNLYEKEF